MTLGGPFQVHSYVPVALTLRQQSCSMPLRNYGPAMTEEDADCWNICRRRSHARMQDRIFYLKQTTTMWEELHADNVVERGYWFGDYATNGSQSTTGQ